MKFLPGKYKVQRNKLFIEDVVIEFDFSIMQTIESKDMLIVILEKPFQKIYNENVFGVSLPDKKN